MAAVLPPPSSEDVMSPTSDQFEPLSPADAADTAEEGPSDADDLLSPTSQESRTAPDNGGHTESVTQPWEADALAEALAAAMGSEWGDEQVAEAVALFEVGDFKGARALALEAAAARGVTASCGSTREAGEGESEGSGWGSARGAPDGLEEGAAAAMAHEWRAALDDLACTYEDAGDADRAEALYLRILAWREGVDQYREGNFGVANRLFHKSPHYQSVEDATWFLQTLRPEDGHAAEEVVSLLSLGEEVAAKAAVGVWTLCLKKENRERIVQCGGLELVVKAMQYHSANAELQAAGCGALRLLSGGHPLAASSRDALADRLDGVQLLLEAIQAHPLDTEVQREAMGALQAISARNPEVALRVVDSDGIGLCLKAATDCPDEGVGDAACKALTALQCATEAEETNAGGHTGEGTDPPVQNRKLRALSYCDRTLKQQLLRGEGPNRLVVVALLGCVAALLDDASLARRVVELAEVVVQCMLFVPGHVRVQQPGVSILWRITDAVRDVPMGRVDISQCVAPVVQAMRDMPTNLEVQRGALGTLSSIAQDNNNMKTIGVRAGGIPAIIEAMKRYPKDPDLQLRALGALTRLCDTLGRARVCQKSGGLEVVVGAVRRHSGFGRVPEMGCVLLCMFCDDAKLRQQVLAAGAMEVAQSLLRAPRQEARHWGQELLKDLTEAQQSMH